MLVAGTGEGPESLWVPGAVDLAVPAAVCQGAASPDSGTVGGPAALQELLAVALERARGGPTRLRLISSPAQPGLQLPEVGRRQPGSLPAPGSARGARARRGSWELPPAWVPARGSHRSPVAQAQGRRASGEVASTVTLSVTGILPRPCWSLQVLSQLPLAPNS